MTSTLVSPIAVRPRLEPSESDGVIAIHEFDVAGCASVPAPHRSNAFEHTNRGSGPFMCVWERTSDGRLKCVWL